MLLIKRLVSGKNSKVYKLQVQQNGLSSDGFVVVGFGVDSSKVFDKTCGD